MAIDHVFRSTPQLGPALISKESSYWFLPPETYNDGSTGTDDPEVSYRLGNVEMGADGHHYVMVVAGGALDAEDVVTISSAWVATGDAGGSYEVPADIEGGAVASGDYFHARKISEGYPDAT